MAKIVFDARLYGPKNTGIGRYEQNLISELSELDKDNEYVFVTHPDTQITKLPPKAKIVQSDVRHYTVREQTEFLRLLNSLDGDLYHIPHFNVPLFFNKPFIVTIHDLLWHQRVGLQATTLPPLTYVLKYAGYRLTVRAAVTKAKAILVPTKTVKETLTQHFAIDPNKIHVTYEAPDKAFGLPSHVDTAKKYSLQKPYIIYTGSLYPHKNVEILLPVLAALPNLTLAIVSARNVFWDKFKIRVRQMKLQDRVRMLGYVSDEDLRGLYHQAEALIQPSTSEGFGLTGLEGMLAGVPVVASDTPILREVYGQAALLVDTTKPEKISEVLKQLLDDGQLRTKLIVEGKKQAAHYSWHTMAQQTAAAYNQVLEQ